VLIVKLKLHIGNSYSRVALHIHMESRVTGERASTSTTEEKEHMTSTLNRIVYQQIHQSCHGHKQPGNTPELTMPWHGTRGTLENIYRKYTRAVHAMDAASLRNA
jgi:hypothetical protein